MFLSSHSAISNCDHVVDMLKHAISNCITIDDVKMHQSKCTNIVKNVLCRHFEEELTNDIGNNKFSLLLDESNDISVKKLLGASIVYYSHSSRKVESTYLGTAKLLGASIVYYSHSSRKVESTYLGTAKLLGASIVYYSHSSRKVESTYLGTAKLLGASIVYYSHSSRKVESTYLGTTQLKKCDAESIVTALKQLLINKKVNISNSIAIGTENASVMVGINNGVYAKLQTRVCTFDFDKMCMPLLAACNVTCFC